MLLPACLTGPGACPKKRDGRPQPGGRRRRAEDDCSGAAKPPGTGPSVSEDGRRIFRSGPVGTGRVLLGLVATRHWQDRVQRDATVRRGARCVWDEWSARVRSGRGASVLVGGAGWAEGLLLARALPFRHGWLGDGRGLVPGECWVTGSGWRCGGVGGGG